MLYCRRRKLFQGRVTHKLFFYFFIFFYFFVLFCPSRPGRPHHLTHFMCTPWCAESDQGDELYNYVEPFCAEHIREFCHERTALEAAPPTFGTTVQHLRRPNPQLGTTVQHLRRPNPYCGTTVQHFTRPEPHGGTTVQHFTRPEPHCGTTVQHFRRLERPKCCTVGDEGSPRAP